MTSIIYSLVIPCYNEAENLPSLLKRCSALTKNSNIEIIIVDNGSTDKTEEVLQILLPNYPGIRSIRVSDNKGYGYGIICGLKAAVGNVLGWTHADMQADPQDFLEGLRIIEEHGSNVFVKGRRYGRPFMDTFFSLGMGIFETLLLFKPMWEINAQPTIFSRKFFEVWATPPDDFSLDLYAYYQAQVNRIKIYRFPVRFGKRLHGSSHWNVDWNSKIKFIRRTINFSLLLKKNINS